jgi:trigger factor
MIEVKRENLGKTKVKLDVKVPSKLMVGFFEKVYKDFAPTVEVKGFRKGHAPKHLTISAVGEARINQEIINLALSETYVEALKKEEIIPVAPPQINVKMLKDLLEDTAELEYEAEIELIPEIKLGEYKKIKVKKMAEIKITEEEVNQVLGHLQRQHAEFEAKDDKAELGDRIEMDFEGTEKGVVLENLTSKNYPVILGSKVLIPEFEKEVIGLKKGDHKEFTCTLGKDSNKKKVDFKVDILLVQKVILPALNDDLAGKFQQGSMESLTKAVRADIMEQKMIAQRREQEGEIAEGLLKIAKVEVPESLIEQEIHRMIDEMRNRTEMMGLPFEQYLLQIKKTEADVHKEFHEQAEKTVKVGLIMGEVGKREKLDLKDEKAGHLVMAKLLEYATNK